jgi:hypothetical protein
MTEEERIARIRGQLAQLTPPAWISAMREYHRQHGAYRVEDVVNLLVGPASACQETGRSQQPTTTELLQQMANTKR